MPHTVIIGADIVGTSTADFSHSPSRKADHTIQSLIQVLPLQAHQEAPEVLLREIGHEPPPR